MKVTVIQPGSRHRYFIPQLFEKRGMLELFATDFTTHSWIGRLLKKTGLIKRPDVVDIPPDKIVSADTSVLLWSLLNRTFRKRTNLQYYLEVNQLIASQLMKRGFGKTNVIYCMNVGFADLLESIKKDNRHMQIICDVIIHPRTHHIMNDVAAEFPNWHYCPLCDEDMALRESCFTRTAAVADILLCPSEWVAQGVRDLTPKHADRIRVCAYGSSIDYHGKRNTPVQGRFFWAGREAIRKGLPYLASAANKLKPRYPDMDFRVAGITDKRIIELPECRNLHFLGQLDNEEMQKEFLSADAFVLPTLSEGLAGVLVEAVACGCPVVTTRCGGLDITEGETGILIPEQNAAALTVALERIHDDRDLRARIAENTSRVATQYSMQAWAERLMSFMESILLYGQSVRRCERQTLAADAFTE